MSRLTVGIAVSIMSFAVLLLLVRTVGGLSSNPLNATFSATLLSNGQTQVCWHSICPGLAAPDAARAILDADSTLVYDYGGSTSESECWTVRTLQKLPQICLHIASNNKIDRLELYFQLDQYSSNKNGPPLGDLVTLWGIPRQTIDSICAYGMNLVRFSNNVDVTLSWLRYSDQSLYGDWILDPVLSRTANIVIRDSTMENASAIAMDWRGFWLFRARSVCGAID